MYPRCTIEAKQEQGRPGIGLGTPSCISQYHCPESVSPDIRTAGIILTGRGYGRS